jgi:hypothetical protein
MTQKQLEDYLWGAANILRGIVSFPKTWTV